MKRCTYKTASSCSQSLEACFSQVLTINAFSKTKIHLKQTVKVFECLMERGCLLTRFSQKNNSLPGFSGLQSSLCSNLAVCPRPEHHLGSRRALCLCKQLSSQLSSAQLALIHSYLQHHTKCHLIWIHS